MKRIFLAILAVLVAVQVPFIYRRYKIGQLSSKISEIQKISADLPKRELQGFTEYKGVMHVHTSLGGHSTGKFRELIHAANENALDFVVMTEHYDLDYDTSALTLNGMYGNTLFVNGQEVDTNDGGRFLLIPGSAASPGLAKLDTKTFLETIHAENRIAINNYPDRERSDNTDFDGMEAYSLHINGKAANPFTAVFDIIWSFPKYGALTYATYFRRNDDYLRRYDAVASTKRMTLTTGSDAHSNKGYYLIADDEGNKHFGFRIDDYSTVFRLVRTHILLETGTPLSRASIIEALRMGRSFTGFDVLGDTAGFAFSAENGSERRIMGDEIAVENGVRLSGSAPAKCRFVLLRNGVVLAQFADVSEFAADVTEKGEYRVEAYLDRLGSPFDAAPWIMSNPIYVR